MTGDVVHLQWMGDPADVERPWFREFVSYGSAATPRLIWWVEPDLSGLADLLFTQELTHAPPQRVRPFEWCYRIGGLYFRGWYDQANRTAHLDPPPPAWVAHDE